MERHSSIAMFISEIPVRCMSSTGNGEKTIKWIGDLNSSTTARDVIISILPACDPIKYSLYMHVGRKKQILNDSARIYKVVASINEGKYSRRLLFEIRLKKIKKRVRFADEIIIQNIVKGQCITNENVRNNIIETISIPIENLKEKYFKLTSISKRSTLSIINENIPRSSSESGISSHSSNDDLIVSRKILETLV